MCHNMWLTKAEKNATEMHFVSNCFTNFLFYYMKKS